MAEVSLSPVPPKIGIMSARRVPLADVPNAANSPYRLIPASISKRSRFEVDIYEDSADEQQHPSKKQACDNAQSQFRTPPKKLLQRSEGRIFNKKSTNSQPTAFERKLHAARDKQLQQKTEHHEKASTDSLDIIRQWQKHYRRVFPHYVFYFESMPDDVRTKCSRHVKTLGAREEKFFSKAVTHVVTTRAIPVETDATSPTEEVIPSNNSSVSQATGQARTINPLFLEQSHVSQSRNKFISEASLSRKPLVNHSKDGETRKQNSSNSDILSRAREMGMKIWQLEKLQRITSTMLDSVAESQLQHVRNTRATGINVNVGFADLSRMLRNEQLNGPSDRDSTAVLSEIIPFKGPHIYIRDMDEKTKPIMFREYRRPTRGEKGDWPQLRCVSAGKCPFVEETAKVRDRQEPVTKIETKSAPRTRAATALEKSKSQPSVTRVNAVNAAGKQVLAEPQLEANSGISQLRKSSEQKFCAPPPFVPLKGRSPTKGLRGVNQGFFAAEPAASGLQPSNITSAIRSQMISSTAAAPGAKAGTSKEFQELKRKVLERNSGPGFGGIQVSQKINDLGPARAERSIAAVRQTRTRKKEALIHVDEESTQSEGEDRWKAEELKMINNLLGKHVAKRDPKPGYCENCRDKYDDFDEHIVGRRHRKFALTSDNWKDLDKLLSQLGRQLKEENPDEF